MKNQTTTPINNCSQKRAEYLWQQFNKLNSLCNLVIGAVNTIAGKAVFDARALLKQRQDLWRLEVKHRATKATQAYYSYEKMHMKNFDDRYNLFIDYLDSVEEDIQPHIDKLCYSIAQVLTKYHQKDSMLKARIETARTLCEYACGVFDRIMKEAQDKTHHNFAQVFAKARLTEVLFHWSNVSDHVCRTEPKDLDIQLNNDPNCRLAFQIIERKLVSEDFLNKAGYEALKLKPDCKKYVSEEDYRELEQKFENNK